MEVTPGVIIVVAVVVVVSFVLFLWGRRHEAAPPVDAPGTRAGSSTMAVRDEREAEPLVNWLLDRALEQTGVNVAGDPLARQRIVQAAGEAMEQLRTRDSAFISLPFLVADAQGPRHFDVRFRRNADSSFELHR